MAKRASLFARFDLDYADHPKIAPLSDAAFRAHVEMILYSRRFLTDGRIAKRVANRWGTESVTELLTNDPERPSLIELPDGDYMLHEFAEMQETRDEVERRRAVNRENGKRGGRPAKRNKTQSVTESVSESGTETETEMKAETETETDIDIPPVSPPRGDANTRPSTRKTRIPNDWQPNDSHRQKAIEQGIDLTTEAEKFRDHAIANGKTFADWSRGFHTWLNNVKTFAPRPEPKTFGQMKTERLNDVVQRHRQPEGTDPWQELRRQNEQSQQNSFALPPATTDETTQTTSPSRLGHLASGVVRNLNRSTGTAG